MPESTIVLVKDLIGRLNKFTELSDVLGPELHVTELEYSVSLSYSSLTFKFKKSGVLYFQYVVDLEAKEDRASECYSHDREKSEMLKRHFEPLSGREGASSLNTGGVIFTEWLSSYLTIAESIARCGYQCAKGDDYRPGYFSEIVVRAEGITLKQINHMNAKSLDHKKDYSLRDLEFFVPLGESVERETKRLRIGEDYIGVMRVSFSDRSSENNKVCGEGIWRQIEEEKKKFR